MLIKFKLGRLITKPDNKIKVVFTFLRGVGIAKQPLTDVNGKTLRKPPSRVPVAGSLLGTTDVKKIQGLCIWVENKPHCHDVVELI